MYPVVPGYAYIPLMYNLVLWNRFLKKKTYLQRKVHSKNKRNYVYAKVNGIMINTNYMTFTIN